MRRIPLRKMVKRLKRVGSNLLGAARSPRFATDDVEIGEHVAFGSNVTFNCRKVRIGDGVRFGNNIRIDADVFEIGDYGTIYDDCFFPGPGKLTIGHNFWLGKSAIIDSHGGTQIADNVGVGAHSQLWTHMKYGDVMYGCRFHTSKPLVIEQDAWLVGHCLVSPVTIGARSIAMLGSVITRDLVSDHTYAGVPAKDVTEIFGSQFEPTSTEKRLRFLRSKMEAFARERDYAHIFDQVLLVDNPSELESAPNDMSVFDVSTRSYTKRGGTLEHALMRFLLPDAKFVPHY